MNEFWKSATYTIIKGMKATGNQPGMVARWIATVERWALEHNGLPEAAAIHAWLPYWQVREIYSAAELAPMFPALAVAFSVTDRAPAKRSARRLEHELKFGGLPFRDIEGKTYFAVARCHHWEKADSESWKREIENV